MKKILILCFSLLGFWSCNQESKLDETSVYYFIRHAEKDLSDKTNKNPHLTNKGIERAKS